MKYNNHNKSIDAYSTILSRFAPPFWLSVDTQLAIGGKSAITRSWRLKVPTAFRVPMANYAGINDRVVYFFFQVLLLVSPASVHIVILCILLILIWQPLQLSLTRTSKPIAHICLYRPSSFPKHHNNIFWRIEKLLSKVQDS